MLLYLGEAMTAVVGAAWVQRDVGALCRALFAFLPLFFLEGFSMPLHFAFLLFDEIGYLFHS